MQKYLVALGVMACLFVLPVMAGAADLVPECGGDGQPACQACYAVELVNNVVSWLVMILGVIAAILIVVAGARLVTSGGNASAKEQAKSSMTNLIIGYIIVLSAWLVMDYGLRALLVEGGDAQFGVWNSISCVAQPVSERVTVTQDEVVFIPLDTTLSNTTGWTYVSAGGSGGGGGDSGQASGGGSYTAPCTRLPGPASESQYSCATQQAQCTTAGGIPTLNQTGTVVTCAPRQVVGGGRPADLSAGGACAASLISPHFGSQTANAQCIIRNESACGASMVSRSDVMSSDGRAFSFGPMQINLTVHVLQGCAGYPAVLNCSSAFSGRNYSARVINEALYQQCARAAQNPTCNIRNGARIYREAGNSWRPWSTAAGCGL